jgi:type I site-specific restriction-modification system R (restriction) subunit
LKELGKPPDIGRLMSKFTEAKLEQTFIEFLENQQISHVSGKELITDDTVAESKIPYGTRNESEVLIKSDLKNYLLGQYKKEELTDIEAESIILGLKRLSSADIYESNKTIMRMLSDGFSLKREDRSKKDIWIYLIDYSEKNNNTFKFVNQLEIVGTEKRIPDGIIYINGIPVVVLEFKSAIREEATIHDAYVQLTTRYRRDIPELFKYNAFCIISDGVNNKAGSFFAPYEFYYAWRRISGLAKDAEGFDSMFTLIQGMLHQKRLRDIIQNFIHLPDSSKKDQKISITEKGVKKTFGFAKYLHDSLPNATYVGFTGTPIDATLDVFGPVVDSYTMTESVRDEITVRIVYEGRAAKIVLNNSELKKIEEYYKEVSEEGANEYQIEESKKATASMNTIIGDPDRLKELAADFIKHYENRVLEAATIKGKAMFVCSSREIAYHFYKNVTALRPEWAKIKIAEEAVGFSDNDKREIKPIECIKMIMTRGKDDPKEMYDLLGTKEYRKELDRQFKNEKSNFKIAIVVDMWLTGFDVPFLDSIYIDKPIQQHSLIQTISRVNRKFEGKNKGLVVDYIGIKKQMNLALAKYNKGDKDNFEDIQESLIVVRDHLDLLAKIFHLFNSTKYFNGSALEQLNTLNMAAEYVQVTKKLEIRYMGLSKRLKAAYDICAGSELLTQVERDKTHFYLAVRSIVFKLTRGDAPDIAQMNAKVREMIKDALASDGVEEIFKLGEDAESEQDIFDENYLAKINMIKLPNTKIKMLQKLLLKAIGEIKKVNMVKGTDFSKKMKALVEKYNERKEDDVLRSEVYEDMAEHLTDLIWEIKKEFSAGDELGIDFEEKAFYDILKELCSKYDFRYPEEKLIVLAKAVKELVDSKAKFPDWNNRADIKSSLKVGLILLLDEHGYPPVERDEVYKDIFEQAENFKKYQKT